MTLQEPVHFIGVGGIGMRGLAKLCSQQGMRVSASERQLDPSLEEQFRALGVNLIKEADDLSPLKVASVVYSSAISAQHPQRLWAEKRGLLMHRSQCLAHFFHQKKHRIAVAGTHGKTTTSSWLAHVLNKAWGAGYCVGGIIKTLGDTADLGQSDTFVIEADESDGSMFHYRPTHLVITNLEADHLDYWKEPSRLFEAMKSFASQAQKLILCADDPLLKSWKDSAVLYGFDSCAQMQILHFESDEQGSQIELSWLGQNIGVFRTRLWGRHNALNMAAVLCVCLSLGLNLEVCRSLIATFEGSKRRLECLGTIGSTIWYDDYAHHPSEIKATLSGIRSAFGSQKNIRVIFQPHRATRLRDFMDEFACSFNDADELWLVPLYLAGEASIEGINSQELSKRVLISHPQLLVRVFSSISEAQGAAREKGFDCDVSITMGAGDITNLGRSMFLEKKPISLER